jgi:choline dehydrogenase-like flavoprotein
MLLQQGELRTLSALADALLPPGASEWRASTADRAAGYLRFLSRRELGQVRLVLRLLETPTPGLLLTDHRRRARFSELSVAERGQVLHALATARIPQVRVAFEGFKRLIAIAYYADAPTDGPNPIWRQLGYPGPLAPGGDDAHRLAVEPVDYETTLECDCVIVGSGTGGSVVAGELASHGWNVVVLEQGPQACERDFHQREVATLNRMYLDGGLAGTSDRGVSILAGRCLGGGTVVNFTTSLRTPEPIRREWEDMTGSPIFAPEPFGKALDAVSERLHVNALHNRPSRRDELLESGLRSLGWHVAAMPRNVVDCTQDNVCGFCGLGCVRYAKQSMAKTYLQDAAANGARMIVDCTAERLVMAGDQATGIVARTASGHTVTVQARALVVAAGALNSPALLLRSGIRKAVGRNLHLHPVTAVWARFDEPVQPWTGTLQAVYSDQFADLDSGYGARFETAPVHPAYLTLGSPWESAEQFDARMRDLPRLSLIGILLRDRSAGRVRIDRYGKPLIEYALSRYDQHHVRTALMAAARVLQAAGALEISTSQYRAVTWRPGESLDEWAARADSVGYGVHETIYGSWHQMGTCRIGRSWLDHPNQPESTTVADTVRWPHQRHRRRSVLTPTLTDRYRGFLFWLGRQDWFNWLGPRLFTPLDTWLYPRTHGAIVSAGPPVLPLLLLTTVGRVSGRDQTVPLLYMRRADDLSARGKLTSSYSARKRSWTSKTLADSLSSGRFQRSIRRRLHW